MQAEKSTEEQNSSWRLLAALGTTWLFLAIGLLAYSLWAPARVEISWETATEQGTAGFSLYRSQNRNGEFVLVNESGIIESQGGPVSGATYHYSDENVEAGRTYYYVLEEIEINGSRRRYEDEIFEYAVPKTNIWVNVLIVISFLVGIAMLLAGIKEARKK